MTQDMIGKFLDEIPASDRDLIWWRSIKGTSNKPSRPARESKHKHQRPRNYQVIAKSIFSPPGIWTTTQAPFCAPDFLPLLRVWLGCNQPRLKLKKWLIQ